MLKTKLLHPELIRALAGAGHGSQILITDSNYASDVLIPEGVKHIYLNFMPGKLLVTEILEGVLSAVPIEEAFSMLTDDNQDPEIVQQFRALIPDEAAITSLKRDDFYATAMSHKTSIVIVSADQRLFANIILVVGFIHPDGSPQY